MSDGELIIADDIVNDPDLLMEAWKRHFRELQYEYSHKDFVEEDLLVMEWICAVVLDMSILSHLERLHEP